MTLYTLGGRGACVIFPLEAKNKNLLWTYTVDKSNSGNQYMYLILMFHVSVFSQSRSGH